MPLHFLKKWPRAFGFEIYGNGPCYVILVDKGSMAYKAGLMPGDQLLEVNGSDVTNMTAEQIRALGKTGSNQPPELEVVSCLKTHVIKPHHVLGYGFKTSNKRPVTVVTVKYGGPAYQSGLRIGDVILEANSHIARGVNNLTTILSQQSGKLTLLTIPVARTSNMVQVDKTLSRVTAPDSKLFRARDLHKRLDNLMSNDYNSKMVVVIALKQYAEDRDISVLCGVLNEVLKTKFQKQILKHIRLLIPPTQRSQFDGLIHFDRAVGTPLTSYSSSGTFTRTAHHMGQRKIIQVLREADSFGFVIKSSCPTYIESIDPGGAAEKAGLQPGDYFIKLNGIDVRKCDHDKLVQLLQDSGSSPTLEILRCASKTGSIRTVVSTSSSSSSHSSVDNILYSNIILDKEGNTFAKKAHFLLTSKEWKTLKKAVTSYDMNRDIIALYNSASAILDTPSKKMLWSFLFVLLSSPHREYVSHHVNIPLEVLMDIVKPDGNNSDVFDGQNLNLEESDMGDFPPSFKQQIDFLLTSGERSQFKKCLKEYKSNLELGILVKTLESILDTPSKKILWRFVLPYLTNGHREVMKERLNLLDLKTVSSSMSVPTMESYIGSPDDDDGDNEVSQNEIATNTDADILYGGNQLHFHNSSESSSDESENTDYSNSPPTNRKLVKGKPRSTSNDSALMKELEETKRAVQDVQNILLAQGKYKPDATAPDVMTEESSENVKDHHFVTIIPVGYPDFKHDQLPFSNHQVDSQQLSSLRNVRHFSWKSDTAQNAHFLLHDIHNDSLVTSSSDDDSDKGMKVGYDLIASKYSRQSNSLGEAHETSDDDLSLRSMNFGQQETYSRGDSKEVVNEKVINKEHFQPPPPPPPPPLSYTGLGTQESSERMNVKRINWEKLDNKKVQNTIWEKLSDHDLGEVIQYLELETQFNSKTYHHKDSEKRKEVLIMDKKKAYNISILLGHLKMPVADVKKALYSMDEKALSPELIGQLLAFSPSEQEISQYRLYKGDISVLTKPDQFGYQMSLVEDYGERLKALRLKASFKEKVEEIRKNLENIKTASLELRNSKKLAHLLEIILAMGNYMNKGNTRVGEAAGFRISFLTQLDVTKTADKKSSFLHVLAEAACSKFPDTLVLADELSTVEKAAKVSIQTLIQDIQELKRVVKETSSFLDHVSNHAQNVDPDDQFQEVMNHFMVDATDEMQSIFRLQASAMDELSRTAEFFGENPKTLNMEDMFRIFSEFIKNFEKAHRHNLMFKRQ